MALYKNLPYDTPRDFVAVSIFSESPNILVVNSSSPAKSMSELIAMARAKLGVLNYSSAGTGTTQHLAGELLKLRTGTNIVHVPYKGSAPSLTALIAGDVDLSFANVPAILQHVKSRRLRPLASTGTRRSELMPDVPTMREAGLTGLEVTVCTACSLPRRRRATSSIRCPKRSLGPRVPRTSSSVFSIRGRSRWATRPQSSIGSSATKSPNGAK